MREDHIFFGLVSLVSLLPVTPQVRAAALRAIAEYPNVKSLGPVDGGQGLEISFRATRSTARLVIDPATSQVRETNFIVLESGGLLTAGEGGTFTVDAGWTDSRPE